jgi:hypothetical protein
MKVFIKLLRSRFEIFSILEFFFQLFSVLLGLIGSNLFANIESMYNKTFCGRNLAEAVL